MKILNKKNNLLFFFFAALFIGLSYLAGSLFFKNSFNQKPEEVGFFDTIASSCIYPLLKIQQAFVDPFRKKISYHIAHEQLYKKALLIQEENDSLKAHIISLEATAVFAEKIKEVVEFQSRYTTDYAKLARVIMRHISTDEHSCLIDSGSMQGVQNSMAVIHKNNLIGKVTHVYPYYSKVLLITDQRCPVSCYCIKTKTEGIFQGVNSTEIGQMLHVDRLHELKVGDTLISSGEGLIFPEGFAIGTVTAFNPDGIHFSIQVAPFVDLYTIDYCYVIQKGQGFSHYSESEVVS